MLKIYIKFLIYEINYWQIHLLYDILTIYWYGGVSEWFKEPVLKTGDPSNGTVGSNPTPSAICFKIKYFLEKYSSGWRGAPAKGVGRLRGARVQIPPSPLKNSIFTVLFLWGFEENDCVSLESFDTKHFLPPTPKQRKLTFL